MDFQDTFQMLLPPIKTKHAQDGKSVVLWMKGAEVRSRKARDVRWENRQERWETRQERWENKQEW